LTSSGLRSRQSRHRAAGNSWTRSSPACSSSGSSAGRYRPTCGHGRAAHRASSRASGRHDPRDPRRCVHHPRPGSTPPPHRRKMLGRPRCNGRRTRSAPAASELNQCPVTQGSARSGQGVGDPAVVGDRVGRWPCDGDCGMETWGPHPRAATCASAPTSRSPVKTLSASLMGDGGQQAAAADSRPKAELGVQPSLSIATKGIGQRLI